MLVGAEQTDYTFGVEPIERLGTAHFPLSCLVSLCHLEIGVIPSLNTGSAK